MEETKYDGLKLENQICFPLYACSKEIIRRYKPYLDRVNLTYTQYIAMMVLWEKHSVTVKELGQLLYLDSGTLTPVLKKLEAKGYIVRKRSTVDERSLIISVTENGEALKDQAVEIPVEMGRCVHLDPEESKQLYHLLYKVIAAIEEPKTAE